MGIARVIRRVINPRRITLPLETQAQLCLEGPGAGLRGDVAKGRAVAAQDQAGSRRLRMVEDVESIHAQLEALRLSNLEPLAHGAVKTPGSRQFHHILAESSPGARLRVLQHDLACRIGDRIESA